MTAPVLTDDYQFSLSYPGGSGATFGRGQLVQVEKFAPGTVTHRHTDQPAPKIDAMLFGIDLQTPPLWTFTLWTNTTTTADALAALDPLAKCWNAKPVRSVPGAVSELRYSIAGRSRSVFGRPRQFTPVPTAPNQGRIDVVADFQLAENISYDVDTNQASVGINPSTITGTGFSFPIKFPIYAATTPIARTGEAIIGGSAPTWVTVTMTGPVGNPWVQIGDQRFALTGTVAVNETITLTGQPWSLTGQQGIYSSTSGYRSSMLDPRSRLSQLRFDPGTYPVTFGGFDTTGTATASVSWRNAYYGM